MRSFFAKHRTGIIHVVILMVAVVITYAVTLKGPFLWDDEVTVAGNALLSDWSRFPDIFTSSLFGGKIGSIGFYRPLATVTYFFDARIFGMNAWGFHLTSIVLHAFNALLVYAVFLLLKLERRYAFAGAFLFAVHPVQIEAVTYISGRNDVLFLFFSLLSIYAFLRGMRGKNLWYLASILTFVLALLSKENAVVVPVLLVPFALMEWKETKQKAWMIAALTFLLAITGGYTLSRVFLIGGAERGSLSWIAEASISERIWTIPRMLLTYVRLLFWPHPLHMEYQFVETSPWNPWLLAGIPFLMLVLALGIRAARHRLLAAAFVFWFFIALLPILNVPIPTPSTLREHWMYLPSIGAVGFLLLMTQSAEERLRPRITRRMLESFFLTVTVALIVVTVARNLDWLDPYRLYAHDVRHEPRSFLLWNNLGVEQYRRGDAEAALASFQKAVETSPGGRYAMAHNNVAVVLEQKGKIQEALSHLRQSILLDQELLAYQNLARILLRQGQVKEAEAVLREGLGRHPDDAQLRQFERVIQTYRAQDIIGGGG